MRDASIRETAAGFGTTGSLTGILTHPPEVEKDRGPTAIVLLNAGQLYRAGPNRLHIRIARDLASFGFPVLRFDFSGIGDSGPRTDNLPFFKSAVEETREAMNYLGDSLNARRFVLCGICSGGDTAFRVACCDERVTGIGLINAGGHLHDPADAVLSADIRGRALARHYLRIAMHSSFRANSWRRGLVGKAAWGRILRTFAGFPLRWFRRPFANALSRPTIAAPALRMLEARGVRVLHIYSEADEGLDYLEIMLGAEMRRWGDDGTLEIVRGANHTFTMLWSQDQLLSTLRDWICRSFAPQTPQAAGKPSLA